MPLRTPLDAMSPALMAIPTPATFAALMPTLCAIPMDAVVLVSAVIQLSAPLTAFFPVEYGVPVYAAMAATVLAATHVAFRSPSDTRALEGDGWS
jgi:hypothetical protein